MFFLGLDPNHGELKSSTFKEILNCVNDLKKDQSQWEKPIPAKFIEIENHIQGLVKNKDQRRNKTHVVKFSYLQKLLPAHSAETFVKYMKSSGFVLTLKSDGHTKDDDVVIDPEWIIDQFRKVVKPAPNTDKDSHRVENWKITKKGLEDLLQPNPDKLVEFLEHLGLVAKPEIETEGKDGEQQRTVESYYVFPSQMKPMVEKVFKKWVNPEIRTVSKSLTLDFRKKKRQIPFPHFDKLITEIIANPPLGKLEKAARNGCIVKITDKPLGYFLCHGSSVVKITMFTFGSSRDIKQFEVCLQIADNIKRISKSIGRRFNQFLPEKPILGLSCDPFPPTECVRFCEVKDLVERQLRNEKCCEGEQCNLVSHTDVDALGGKYNCTTVVKRVRCEYCNLI